MHWEAAELGEQGALRAPKSGWHSRRGAMMGGFKAKSGLAAKACMWEIHILWTKRITGPGIGQGACCLGWHLHYDNREQSRTWADTRQQSNTRSLNTDREAGRCRFRLWLCHLLPVSLGEARRSLFTLWCPSVNEGVGLTSRLQEMAYVDHSTGCPAHSQHSVNIS